MLEQLSWVKKVSSGVFTIGIGLLLFGCQGDVVSGDEGSGPQVEPDTDLVYQVPELKNDSLNVGDLSELNIEQGSFNTLLNQVASGQYSRIDGFAFSYRNKLIYEQSFRQGFSQYDEWINNQDLELHAMHSVSKSVTAILITMAIEQGYIASNTDSVLSYFPEINPLIQNEQKRRISIFDMLTMRAGVEWDEFTYPYGDSRNSLSQLVTESDWTEAFFDLPMANEPGSNFVYNTGATNVLMDLLDRAVPQGAEAYAQQVLFDPLNIQTAQWNQSPTGLPIGGSGLYLKLRDAIKLGMLINDQGVFNGQRLLSLPLTDALTAPEVYLEQPNTWGYGLQWWLGHFDIGGTLYPFYSGRGFGSQYLVVVPSLELVVVTFGQNYTNDQFYQPLKMIEEALLPMIINGQN